MRRRSLTRDLMHTFLDLGDATSRNLGFSHRSDVWVSYGEETITETNLPEIRRRHPHHVRVRTFPKQVEARNGADWEWHIVGLRRTGPVARTALGRPRERGGGSLWQAVPLETLP